MEWSASISIQEAIINQVASRIIIHAILVVLAAEWRLDELRRRLCITVLESSRLHAGHARTIGLFRGRSTRGVVLKALRVRHLAAIGADHVALRRFSRILLLLVVVVVFIHAIFGRYFVLLKAHFFSFF